MEPAPASTTSDAFFTLLAPAWIVVACAVCLPVTIVVLLRIRLWWNSGQPLPLPLDGAPAAVRWSPTAGFALFGLLYVLMWVTVAGYAVVAARLGLRPPWGDESLSPGTFLAQVLPPLVGLALVAGFGRGALATVGVRLGRPKEVLAHGLLAAVAVFPLCAAALIVNALVLVRLGLSVEPPALLKTIQATREPWLLAIALLQAGILAPLGEEFAYRGVLMVSLMKAAGPGPALVGSSVLFAVAHAAVQPQAVLPLFLLGLALAYVAYRTRSLLASVIAHSAFNSLMVVGTFFGGG